MRLISKKPTMPIFITRDDRFIYSTTGSHGLGAWFDVYDSRHGTTKSLLVKRTSPFFVDCHQPEESTILALIHFPLKTTDRTARAEQLGFQLIRIFLDQSIPCKTLGYWSVPFGLELNLNLQWASLHRLCHDGDSHILISLPNENNFLSPYHPVTTTESSIHDPQWCWSKVTTGTQIVGRERALNLQSVDLHADSMTNRLMNFVGLKPNPDWSMQHVSAAETTCSSSRQTSHTCSCSRENVTLEDEIDGSKPAIINQLGHVFIYVPSIFKLVYFPCASAVLSSDKRRVFYRSFSAKFGVCDLRSLHGPIGSLTVKSARLISTENALLAQFCLLNSLPTELHPLVQPKVRVRDLIVVSRCQTIALKELGPLVSLNTSSQTPNNAYYLFAFK